MLSHLFSLSLQKIASFTRCMKHSFRIVLTVFFPTLLFLSGCSVSRFIPEGGYLLDNVRIESDNKEVKPSDMSLYLRQQPNAKWFSLFRLPMYIYSASGTDSSKWVNRFWRKLGEAPVVYHRADAEASRAEIEKAVRNLGYMGASVRLLETAQGNRMKIHYLIHCGPPYLVDSLSYHTAASGLTRVLQADSLHSELHPGMRFDVNVLDQERQRLTRYLQNKGYYRFNKDFISYRADTMRNTHRVGLTLNVSPFAGSDSLSPVSHRPYRIRKVNYLLDVDPGSYSERDLLLHDSIRYQGMNIYYDGNLFLRPRVLADFTALHSGRLYRINDVQNTYSALSRLSVLKYSNIRFTEVTQADTACLDAYVILSKNKNKSLSFEVEGTNSAGDLGAAASVSLLHRNLFKGSEALNMKLRGAYEAVSGLDGEFVNSNYVEFGAEASLNFPQFMFPFLSSDFKRRIRATSEVSLKYNWQIRPEFERTLAAAAWSYRWSSRGKSTHRFDLLDINYVYMPYVSQTFRDYLDYMDNVNPLLRHSYEDLLIVRMGYTYTYNSAGRNAMKAASRNSYSVRFNIEESGNLLYGFSRLFHPKPRYGQAYRLANIDFAQYVKMDLDYAKNVVIDERNSVVFHIGLGVAVPYGNSKSLPFEKLYFSGGANSVRGWAVRSLGPGEYKGNGFSADYVNHTGDIKLDLNLEYRTYLFWKLNGAAFIDAGNVWNIRKQGEHTEGLFRFDRFYRQLAVAYGLGIRFDLDFLILRFDGGMKAINPMATGRERFPICSPNFGRDFAFHFAVGYPF